MRCVDLKKLQGHFVEGAIARFHAHDAARCRAQLLFGRIRILDPSLPRRPEIPDAHKHLRRELYPLHHQELPVASELELRPIGLANQRGLDFEKELRRARVAVAALDRPNTIGRKPCGSPMLTDFRRCKRWVNPRDPRRLKSPGLVRKVACYDDVLGRYLDITEPIAAAAMARS